MTSLPFHTLLPLSGSVVLPGCKSYTNRALLCAAAAPGTSRLTGVSPSDDSQRMRRLLASCGVAFRETADALELDGLGGGAQMRGQTLDVGDTGTALRFLLPFVAAGSGESRWTGSARLAERPIEPLLKALDFLGARFEFEERPYTLPFRLHASGLRGGEIEIASDQSSQFLSGMLMAAPLAREPLRVRTDESSARSRPYAAMTRQVQSAFGVSDRGYRAASFRVPGDASAAFWFFAAIALAGGELRIRNLAQSEVDTTLCGMEWGDRLGFSPLWEGEELRVRPSPGRAFEGDFSSIPDLVPAAAIVALFLPGTSVISGVPHLRWKESDRLAALGEELAHTGARIATTADGLRIEGGHALHAAPLDSRGDHRLAVAFALAGLRVPGIEVSDLACVSKSYPAFFQDFRRLFRDNPAP